MTRMGASRALACYEDPPTSSAGPLTIGGGGGQSTGCGRVELFGFVLTNMRSNGPSHTCALLTDLPQRSVDAPVAF